MEVDLLLQWRLVGGVNSSADLGTQGGAHVGEVLVAEGLDQAVELGGVGNGEASQQNCAAGMEEGLQPRFAAGVGDGVLHGGEVRRQARPRPDDGREETSSDRFLFGDGDLDEHLRPMCMRL